MVWRLPPQLPKQIRLNRKTDLCGYISPSGKYYHCDHYGHERLAKELIQKTAGMIWSSTHLGLMLPHKTGIPVGMTMEEYYLMKEKKYAKISSFRGDVDQMWLFSYYDLTPQQTDFIYPR